MWLSFSNTELSFWFPVKTSKSQPTVLAECLKVVVTRIEMKSIHTCLHTSNENLELRARKQSFISLLFNLKFFIQPNSSLSFSISVF